MSRAVSELVTQCSFFSKTCISHNSRRKGLLGLVSRIITKKRRESAEGHKMSRAFGQRMSEMEEVEPSGDQISGFRVQGSGFRVQGAWSRVQGAGFRVQGSGFRVQGAWSRVQGAGFRGQCSGFRVQGSGSGFRDQGPGFRV